MAGTGRGPRDWWSPIVRRWEVQLVAAIAALLAVGGIALLGAAWYYAGVLERDGLRVTARVDRFDLVLASSDPGTVTLAAGVDPGAEWHRDGEYGLAWEGGSGRVGRIVEQGPDRVVRVLQSGPADLPPPGTPVRLDAFVFPGDPLAAHGIPFTDVPIPGEQGSLPAWRIEGTGTTWAIFVHGRNAPRRESLRALPAFCGPTGRSLPCLVISYRNDPGAPRSESGRYDFGATEWRDLEAAVRYAVDSGANDVVLIGYSMGGGVVLSFMDRSALAPRVRAIVLDAPMLSFESSVDLQAAERGIPGFLTSLGKHVASRRFGIDWDDLDYRERAARLPVPMLVFHGDQDDQTPVDDSDALAARRPDVVTYVRVPGAAHVRAWNVDPAGYAAALGRFLDRVMR